MRVCLVTREFSPFWGAGIGTYAAAMARAWAEGGGHEVHVLTAPHKGLETNAPRLYPGVTFHTLRPIAASEAAQCRYPFHQFALQVFRTFDALHEEHLFEYVEFPDYWGEGYFVLRAKRLGGRYGGLVMGVRLHTPSRLCRELNQSPALNDAQATLEHMEEESIRWADLALSPSRALLDWTEANVGLDKDMERGVVVYPFDAQGFARAAGGMVAQPVGPGPGERAARNPPVVLYFGRLERRKGVETLIDAGRRLVGQATPVQLRLIGGDTDSGPGAVSMQKHLKSMLHNLRPEHFVFEPPRAREALGDAVRRASVVCLPSLWENFPNACLEAMALGACVVASDTGGMSEIVEDGVSGVLFHGGNATNLAATLRRVLADPDLRARCGRSAPGRVARLCNPEEVLKATFRAIRKCQGLPRTTPKVDVKKAAKLSRGLHIPFIRARGGRDAGPIARAIRRLLIGRETA
ncbi:MAG: glycosyltransferase family 4 protein [Phycisphaerales bacterium]|nr:glycosyltransferase family 4 protein [Phycisphaerales bacterium]